MIEYRYLLEPYKTPASRYDCPGCGKIKTFSRYLDTETGEHLHPTVGRCNREINCGYHYTPKQYFEGNPSLIDTSQRKPYNKRQAVTPQPKHVTFISVEAFKASLKSYEDNNFAKFLISLIGVEVSSQLISRYFIATSKHWNGATVFWQIDIHGKIRTGKIMLYNPDTGKRVKEPFNHISWVHKALKEPEFELQQCLFGEHLLHDETKPVAIVESEKTAVIASAYLPQFIWLAVGSLTNLNAEKCCVLKGRNVTLFPDLNGFKKWSDKAKELSRLFAGIRFNVSDLLERKATEAERKQGLDLADYLIKFDCQEFALPQPETIPCERPQIKNCSEDFSTVNIRHKTDEGFITVIKEPESWEQEITELENYFNAVTLPAVPIKLDCCSTITNVSLFIESHIATVKTQNGKQTYLPYLHRLQELKTILTINSN